MQALATGNAPEFRCCEAEARKGTGHQSSLWTRVAASMPPKSPTVLEAVRVELGIAAITTLRKLTSARLDT